MSLTLLQNDYLALSKEAGRRYADVRDAADQAYQLVRNSKDQAIAALRTEPPPSTQPLYQPIFLAPATRNAKVIALAVSSLQRLIVAGAVPKSLVPQILEILEQVVPQGVEIQLKVLQTLVSLLTTKVGGSGDKREDRLVQGEQLGVALELSHRLSTSKIPVVASTASATLRQLFMFVFERVGEEDAAVGIAKKSLDPNLMANLPPADFTLDVPPNEHDAAATQSETSLPNVAAKGDREGESRQARSIKLRPAARDGYLLLEDLCLLIAGSGDGSAEGEPSFLRWASLSRTFGLELVESIVSGFGSVVRHHPELLLVLRAHLCPLLIRFLSTPPNSSNTNSASFSFPLTLRITRVVFLLLKYFSDLLVLESEVFLTMFVRIIGPGDRGEGEGGHPAGPGAGISPLWMRVLALEIFRGLCADFQLMIKFFKRYDSVKKESNSVSGGASSVFSDLMIAFNRLATEKPASLGVGAAVIYGSSMTPNVAGHPHSTTMSSLGGAAGMIEGAMGMGMGLAQVAGNVVGSSVGVVAGSIPPGLSVGTAALKLQCIDQLDKADAPPIPDTYIFLLVLQCLSSLAEGFATYALPKAAEIKGSKGKDTVNTTTATTRGLGAIDWSSLEPSDPKIASLLLVKDMAEASWPALLASFSFFIATALDDDLFADVVSALQNFTSVCGILDIKTPREAFLTSLCKFAVPPSVLSQVANMETNSAQKSASNVLTAGVESLGLGPAAPPPIGLSWRNLACLRAVITVAQYIAGNLHLNWLTVIETLQNADFVLRVTASKNRRRTPAAVPATPPRSGPSALSNTNTNASHPIVSTTKTSAVPTEADEAVIHTSIAKFFDVTKSLDDRSFESFLSALCHLNKEVIGDLSVEDNVGSPDLSNSSSEPSKDHHRRRQIGIKILRPGDTSFGVAKLGIVAILNIQRLIGSDPSIGWDIAVNHLLLLLNSLLATSTVRLQAADVLDQILVLAPKQLSSETEEMQKRVQTQVLIALAQQAEPPLRSQSSTDVEVRRMALDCLNQILETSGHSFVADWERIFYILRTACPSSSPLLALPLSPALNTAAPTSPLDAVEADREADQSVSAFSFIGTEKVAKTPILVRTSFPSLQLICTDFMSALTVEELRDCISTLAEFGKQADDVNISLTAGGLLWNVSDHLQAERKQSSKDEPHGELWMFLLHRLLALCQDERQEVRDGAITTIFRSLSLYGATLTASSWDLCMWEIVFPLLDAISDCVGANNLVSINFDAEDLVSQPNGPPIPLNHKQWDDSKTLALKSTANVFHEYLPQIIITKRFTETWMELVRQTKRAFIEGRPQIATCAMQSLEKVLSTESNGDSSRLTSSWEAAWSAWDEIGHFVMDFDLSETKMDPSKTFTQVNLEAFVRVVLPILRSMHLELSVARVRRLLDVLKAVIAFQYSPDFRPDVESLTPVQAAVLEVIAAIDLETDGVPSMVLADLAEYSTLAFVAAFNYTAEPAAAKYKPKIQHVSYIALTKEIMPHVLWLYQRYKDQKETYENGAVQKIFAAYAIPMKLKYLCPAPSKYGSEESLWKKATVYFLRAVRDCISSLRNFKPTLSEPTLQAIWRQIIDAFQGALLADPEPNHDLTSEQRLLEENFDLALLITLEQDVLPHLGSAVVPDALIRQLGKCLQSASRLYELDLDGRTEHQFSISTNAAINFKDPEKETRFDSDYDHRFRGEMHGTTAEIIELGRERFEYWCLDLLFLICSDGEAGHELERRRVAALSLPFLLNRCKFTLRAYIADAPLRGKTPFPRIRQEEITHILQSLLACNLRKNILWASLQINPSEAIQKTQSTSVDLQPSDVFRTAISRSRKAMLFELYPLLLSLLDLSPGYSPLTSTSITRCHVDGSPDTVSEIHNLEGLPAGFMVGTIGSLRIEQERDLKELVIACLRVIGEEIATS